MLRSKTSLRAEGRELLAPSSGSLPQSDAMESAKQQSKGIPQISHRFWNGDFLSILGCVLCYALALTTMFHANTAVRLSEVNQLIALGVLLQLMAFCTQNHLKYFFMVFECLWNKSSLHNFESIIQANFVASNTSFLLRLAIFTYLVFPLGLRVSYRKFTSGATTSAIVESPGLYGWTGQPGTAEFGTTGLALFVNATSPWWTHPATSGAYGFNLHVESTDRSALLDAPMEKYALSLQKMLQHGETLELSTTVNAIVCDMVFDLANGSKPVDLPLWFSYLHRSL